MAHGTLTSYVGVTYVGTIVQVEYGWGSWGSSWIYKNSIISEQPHCSAKGGLRSEEHKGVLKSVWYCLRRRVCLSVASDLPLGVGVQGFTS